jgi:hypothetical protein
VCNFFAEATFDRGADLTSETALVPLFTSPAPPGGVDTAQEEIRLRPLVPLVTQPQPNLSVTSYRLLPSFLRSHLNPRFTRVEMLNSANQSVFPPPTDENEYLVLGARMLHDAVIALTVTQTATAYPSAVISPGQYTRGLLVSDLTSIDEVPNDVIKIIVEGSYLL